MSPEPSPHAAASLLRHEPREAPPHYDWLVDLAIPTPAALRGQGDRVPTFRLAQRLDTAVTGTELAAERIADHRRLYLDLASPRELSEGRGLVTPLRQGSIVGVEFESAAGRFDLEIRWHDDRPTLQRLRLASRDRNHWSILVLAAD